MPNLTVGRIVHVRNHLGQCRAAIVTAVDRPGPNPYGVWVTAFGAYGEGWSDEHRGIKMLSSLSLEAQPPNLNHGPALAFPAFRYWHWPERDE